MEYDDMRRTEPIVSADAPDPGMDALPFCAKAFSPETERFEDDDDPCQNGEG